MEKMDSNAMAIQNLLGDRNPTVVSPNQGSSSPKGTSATLQPLEMSLKSGVLLQGQTSGQNKSSQSPATQSSSPNQRLNNQSVQPINGNNNIVVIGQGAMTEDRECSQEDILEEAITTSLPIGQSKYEVAPFVSNQPSIPTKNSSGKGGA
ncbi:unnamed protein product [Prunus armeniaca]|uniref:Uncharacterized protein n=1 Tax=Prunus armeniaca TaxID=36596 RepID=A0A6J5TK08_PRUAR|nr:unnamed protein product [Prunus armeniaca]CAB4294690.1 unnamed protein product [Prunus armeniaca]